MSLFADFLLSKAWSQYHSQHRPIFQNYQLYIFYFWQHFCISRLFSMYLFIKYNYIVVILKPFLVIFFLQIFCHKVQCFFQAHCAAELQQAIWPNITWGAAKCDIGQVTRAKTSPISHNVQPSVILNWYFGKCDLLSRLMCQNITHIIRGAASCDLKVIFWKFAVWHSALKFVVWFLRSITTIICSKMIWRKNLCLSVAGSPMSHCEQEVLVAVDDGLPYSAVNDSMTL